MYTVRNMQLDHSEICTYKIFIFRCQVKPVTVKANGTYKNKFFTPSLSPSTSRNNNIHNQRKHPLRCVCVCVSGGGDEPHKIEKKCLECFEMREYVNLNLYNQSFFLLSKSLSLQWIFKRLIYTFIVIPDTKNHHIMYYLTMYVFIVYFLVIY